MECGKNAQVEAHRRVTAMRARRARVAVHRLDEMAIETRLRRAPAVVRLSVSRERDEAGPRAPRQGADTARQLVAVDLGQAEIEQRDVGRELRSDGERRNR